MSWSWEYEPSEKYVVGGENPAPLTLVAQVEEKAEELVPAAAARYLDGTLYQGTGEGIKTATVQDGFFLYLVIPRQERLYILQVTAY